jgi:hypothetical protein
VIESVQLIQSDFELTGWLQTRHGKDDLLERLADVSQSLALKAVEEST